MCEGLRERFTDRARKVMELANQEAHRFNHQYLGTEHILLGLVKEGGGMATDVLRKLGISLHKIRLEVEKLIQRGPPSMTLGQLPWTSSVGKVVDYSMEEARNLGHDYVGTEHILLGLLRAKDRVSAVVLEKLGLHFKDVRAEIGDVVNVPEACPNCGRSPVTRVIWDWAELSGKNLEDVQAGRAILGSPLDKGGPPWVCLHCKPKWAEVHLLALEQHDLQIEKENAVVATDFEKAAKCRDRQAEVRRRLIQLLDELSREQ